MYTTLIKFTQFLCRCCDVLILGECYCIWQIKELKEVSLSANQEKSKMKKMIWKVEGDNKQEPQAVRGGPVNMSDFIVELGPMEIRTFLLKF